MAVERARGVLLALASLLLAACASKDTGFYKHAPSMPLLEVPPDLTRPEVKNEFEIPQIGALLNKQALLAGGATVRLVRDGRLRWLVFNRPPEAVWAAVRDYWVANGVHLAWENKGLGIMETAWLPHYELSEFAKDRFRVRIEPGSAPGSSELYLSHRGLQEAFVGGEIVPVWTERASDPELEVELLGQMLVFFGLDEKRARAIVAEAGKPGARAELAQEGKVPVLYLTETRERGWKLLLQAVDRLGYVPRQREPEQGRLLIELDENGDGGGFVPGFAMAGLERKRYHLQLEEAGQRLRITVRDPQGRPEASRDAHQLLQRLREQLQ